MPRPKKTLEQIAPSLNAKRLNQRDCFQLYLVNGWGPAEMSRATGIKEELVKKWSSRYKWPEQKSRLEKLAKKEAAARPIVSVVAKKKQMAEVFSMNMAEIAVNDSEEWKKMTSQERLEVASGLVPLANLARKTFDLDKEEEGNKERGNISLSFHMKTDAVKVLPGKSTYDLPNE